MLAEGRPVALDDYRDEHRFAVPQSYMDAGLMDVSRAPLSNRGRTESAANLLATSLLRAQSEEALNHAQRLS